MFGKNGGFRGTLVDIFLVYIAQPFVIELFDCRAIDPAIEYRSL